MTKLQKIYKEFAKGHGLQMSAKRGYITYYGNPGSQKKALSEYWIDGRKKTKLVNIETVIKNFNKISDVI